MTDTSSIYSDVVDIQKLYNDISRIYNPNFKDYLLNLIQFYENINKNKYDDDDKKNNIYIIYELFEYILNILDIDRSFFIKDVFDYFEINEEGITEFIHNFSKVITFSIYKYSVNNNDHLYELFEILKKELIKRVNESKITNIITFDLYTNKIMLIQQILNNFNNIERSCIDIHIYNTSRYNVNLYNIIDDVIKLYDYLSDFLYLIVNHYIDGVDEYNYRFNKHNTKYIIETEYKLISKKEKNINNLEIVQIDDIKKIPPDENNFENKNKINNEQKTNIGLDDILNKINNIINNEEQNNKLNSNSIPKIIPACKINELESMKEDNNIEKLDKKYTKDTRNRKSCKEEWDKLLENGIKIPKKKEYSEDNELMSLYDNLFVKELNSYDQMIKLGKYIVNNNIKTNILFDEYNKYIEENKINRIMFVDSNMSRFRTKCMRLYELVQYVDIYCILHLKIIKKITDMDKKMFDYVKNIFKKIKNENKIIFIK